MAWHAPAIADGQQAADGSAAISDQLVVEGNGRQPLRYRTDELRAMPATELQARLHGEHGQDVALYKGVLLWDLLCRGQFVDPSQPRGHVRQTVTVTGRDGYTAVLALAEIDPEFEGKQAIVAYDRDGKPVGAGHLRLVVPGDKRGGRSVRDVVRLGVN